MASGSKEVSYNTTVVISSPKPPGWDVPTMIPWFLTGLGFIITVAVAAYNLRKAKELQSNNRRQQLQLEEFRRIRAPVDSAIQTLRTQRRGLNTFIPMPAGDIGLIRTEAAPFEKAIAESFVDLSDGLASFDHSPHAAGSDWLVSAEGHWDAYNDSMFRFSDKMTSDVDRKGAFDQAVTQLQLLLDALEGRLNAEFQRHLLS
jgi:hypothetical protein